MKPSAVSLSVTTSCAMITGSIERMACGSRMKLHHPALAQADGVAGLALTAGQGLDARAEDFGQHGAVVEQSAG